jgi:hypothetical protein
MRVPHRSSRRPASSECWVAPPPVGAGGDPGAVEDGHLDATLPQEPGGRQADHPGSDDDV